MKSPEFYHFVAASALAATACAQEPQQLKDVQYNLHFDGFRVPCEQVLQQATLEKGYCVGESPRK